MGIIRLKREFTQEEKETIIKMYTEDNISMRKIGIQFNIDGNIVKKLLNDNGVETDWQSKKKNNYLIDEENNIAKIELKRNNEESIWTIIDLEDLQGVINFPYTWSPTYAPNTDSFYAVAFDYKTKVRWRLNVFIANPNREPYIKIDHKNHDTLDNRKSNLRVTENKENTKHRKGKNSNNQSGYRNVAYMKDVKKTPYHVQLMIDGKNTVLGRFADVDEAGAFAKKMRHKYYGEFEGES